MQKHEVVDVILHRAMETRQPMMSVAHALVPLGDYTVQCRCGSRSRSHRILGMAIDDHVKHVLDSQPSD